MTVSNDLHVKSLCITTDLPPLCDLYTLGANCRVLFVFQPSSPGGVFPPALGIVQTVSSVCFVI